MSPQTMKNQRFDLKTRLFRINTSKHVGFGGPWYSNMYIYIFLYIVFLWKKWWGGGG